MAPTKVALEFQLAKASTKRTIYFTEVESLFKLANNIDDPASRACFESSYRLHDERWEKFQMVVDLENDLMFQLSHDHKPDYTLLTLAEQYRTTIKEAHAKIHNASHPPAWRTNIKLPKIPLPEFNGERTEWPLFFEKFNTLIHSNPELDNLSKMHYLLGALKGKAREVCAGLIPTADNYPVLINALKLKFENKSLLATTYLNQMLDMKTLSEESASSLNSLLTRFDTAYQSLKALSLENLVEFIVGNLLLAKVDVQTRRHFETSNHEKIPIYKDIFQFLYSHAEALAQLPLKNRNFPITKNKLADNFVTHKSNAPKTFLMKINHEKVVHTNVMTSTSAKCPSCSNPHPLYKCPSFHRLSPAERVQLTMRKNLCENCLSVLHSAKFCNSKSVCKFCGEPHHSLLHLNNPTSSEQGIMNKSVSDSSIPVQKKDDPTCTFFSKFSSRPAMPEKLTLLPTAVVLVETSCGDQRARFLVDSGSQSHFVTVDCCKKLNLPVQSQIIPLEGMGNSQLQAIGKSKFVIKSIYDPDFKLEIAALVTQTVTHHLPQTSVDTRNFKFLQQLSLADKNFHQPGPIDGILGAQIFSKILNGGTLSDPQSELQAIQTRLGFIIIGESPVDTKMNTGSNYNHPKANFCIFQNNELTSAVKKFWDLEQVPKTPRLTDEEIFCENFFKTTTTRLPGGRYCVSLPFKEFPPLLGDSRVMAEKRLSILERKFSNSPELFAQYNSVLKDYLHQGHMNLVSSEVNSENNENYIPHFPVFRESSSTPLRIVFDASAKTGNSRSLNDVLFSGPKLQKDITEILTLFRVSPIVLFADIRQMYRNIAVNPEHRRFQRILWRESPQHKFQTYELNCVVFGLTSAPYLALRTVQQLAEDEMNTYPLAAKIVIKHMYVDDLVVSLESVHEAIEAHTQLINLFQSGGFHLTKWASNSPDVLKIIPDKEKLSTTLEFRDSSHVPQIMKVLGLKWDSHSDNFFFSTLSLQSVYTKRGILSIIARIYDPLGFLTPVTLFAKLLIKDIWSSGIGWDDTLPFQFYLRWQQFMEQLPLLQQFQIQRYLNIPLSTPVALIGFADSSERGYGAVIYIRSLSFPPIVQLLYAKSRVAPQKTVTLPRLELCAALLLAQLMEFSLNTLSSLFNITKKFAFTDSTATLGWIKNTQCKRDVFVSHRVSAIDKVLHPHEWYHIRSLDNVADIISRGLSPSQFIKNKCWISGPSWLQSEISHWPINQNIENTYPTVEHSVSPSTQVLTVTNPTWEPIPELISRSSSWTKLCHTLVYILRFGNKLPIKPFINASDLEIAETYPIRIVQQQYFASDFALIANNQEPSKQLRPLKPFIHDNCIRVGGRLKNAPVAFQVRHPLLLPNCHLTDLMIDFYHKLHLHAGPTLLMALIRQKYWILSARKSIRRRLHRCIKCFRNNSKNSSPLTAPFPTTRVTAVKPFTFCGVDYAGPFSLILQRRRGAKSQKGCICLFICFTTKAIHLELASDLSTHAFLQCFTRFLARRGPVSIIHSDCGTNFVGAKAKLENHYALTTTPEFQTVIGDALATRRIEWRLNPPSAPHFGGLWEANIKSVKTHLYRVVGDQLLSWEEFNTLLTQIESILTSRPLTVLSDDPTEPEALTPAHFLQLTPLRNLPLAAIKPDNLTLRNRKQLLDHLINSFWKRWSLEYLSTLHPRKGPNSPTTPLEMGTVVLVQDDNLPPLRWPLGTIEAVHPGADGVIRVASVRFKNAVLLRPVVKLYPLPRD